MHSDNELLRFYKTCAKWKTTVDDSPTSRKEKDKFLQSKVFKQLLSDVSKRLGFLKTSEILSEEQVMTIFNACRYDFATQIGRKSPWCYAFDSDNLAVMEYVDDMEHYWTDSYGNKLNYQQACPPVRDMIDHIRLATTGSGNEKKALLRFTHQGFMQKFFALLGLFKDKHQLTSSWWSSSATSSTSETTASSNSQSTESEELDVYNRKYRLSKIGPFSANIVFILYKCPSYKIKAFVQEREIRLPGCSKSLCELGEFFDTYNSIAKSCDVEKICKI